MLDAAGKTRCVLGLALDITEKRKLLDALKIEAERYCALAQIAGGLLWTGSSDGGVTALSNAKETEDQGYLAKDWVDLVHEEERDTALREWAVSVKTEEPYNVECRLRQPDGAYRWHRCRAVPLRNGGPWRQGVARCLDGRALRYTLKGAKRRLKAHRQAIARRPRHAELVGEAVGPANGGVFRGHSAAGGV
ncbi:PAS domain-containing protein [Bradyrhizobium hipponense]|uniref:PAS domain-containing protein n=1 Tax=Bradyrhizobium hipponense TaxID=2605638 RepID=UPI001652D579|nr:PAS domain-containing protein [Bradyrhizobium hipponense]